MMNRQTITVALAFVGLVIGAGFASGREILQYFVGFGFAGLWGAALAAIIFALTGMVILQLGSYFMANDHNVVLAGVARPLTSKIFDVLITFTLFCMGLVMIAGGGTNLNQQFGLPIWVGSVIITVLVIAVGMLDVNKVTAIIGGITPFIMVFVLLAIVYALSDVAGSWHSLDVAARSVGSTLPNWFVSMANYVSLALSLAVSMSIVMGGAISDPKVAGRGGFLGGLIFGLLILGASAALFAQVPHVAGDDMPMLTLVNHIHPALGIAMAFIIFGMIFNTAIGMYYALAKRFCGGSTKRFRILLVALTLTGFVLSFVGFKALVGYLYPVIGYMGFALIGVLVWRWFGGRKNISDETERRGRIHKLIRRRLRHDKHFTRKHARDLNRAVQKSPVDDQELHAAIAADVVTQLDEEGLDYHDPEGLAPVSAEAPLPEGSEVPEEARATVDEDASEEASTEEDTTEGSAAEVASESAADDSASAVPEEDDADRGAPIRAADGS